MSSYTPHAKRPTFSTLLRSFASEEGLPFADCLPEEQLQRLANKHHLNFGWVYTPAVVTWAFLSQCLSASKTCVSAVARILVLRASLNLPACSANTGGYCKARSKLPVGFLKDLTEEIADQVEKEAPASWLWKNRHVYIADGTTVSGPDTEENQAEFPQSGNQKPGLGFPLIRLVVLLSYATAMVVGAACGPFIGKGTGETTLLGSILDRLRGNDILVADSYYCVWWLLAQLKTRGIDGVFRLHAARKTTTGKGQGHVPRDQEVVWTKPRKKPEGMDQASYDALPETVNIREVLVRVERRGYRPTTFVVATTLLDKKAYPAADIADLYRQRWHVELDIRSIKQTLKMDILGGQTPEMMRREIWGHLLGYNGIRRLMAQAALLQGCQARHLSLASAVQLYNEFRPVLLLASDETAEVLMEELLRAIGSFRVGKRPDRREPRKVKRRPKDCSLLNKPRAEARAELLNGVQED